LNVLLARGRTHFKCAPPSEALRFHKVVLGRRSTIRGKRHSDIDNARREC